MLAWTTLKLFWTHCKTIIRKVSKKGESFYGNDSNDAAECNNVNNDEEEVGHFNFNFKNINEAGKESLYEALFNDNGTQIKSQFNELSDNLLSKHNANIQKINFSQKTDNEFLIETLQREFAFLRRELNSKDVILKMLLNDRDGLNAVSKNGNNVVKDTNDKENQECQ